MSERGIEYWQGRLDRCFSKSEVWELWNNNVEEIEASPELLKIFDKKRRSFPRETPTGTSKPPAPFTK